MEPGLSSTALLRDSDCPIDHLDEIEAVIVDLSFNVQDDRWLVYCTACGHEHLDLPETDERISIGEPDPFHQAA